MKKLVLTLVAGAFISASMVSCNKCGECQYNGQSTSGEFCQKDNKTAYDTQKLACENLGYDWVTK